MKIAILNNLYFPHEKGGAEKAAANLSAELRNLGHTVFTVSTAPRTYSANANYYLASQYYQLSQKSWPYRLLWQMNNLYNQTKYREIKKIFQKEKPELVITHNLMGLGLLIPRLIKEIKAKHVHILHDLQLLYPSGIILAGQEKRLDSTLAKKYQNLARKLMGSPDLVVSPSRWLLDLHQQRGFFPHSQTAVRLNPIKTIPKIVSERNQKQFIFVGQMEESKGAPFLFSAWQKMPTEYKLIMVGSGSQLEKLQKLAQEKNITNIEFTGRLEMEKVFPLLAQSSALILPSLTYENSPNVIIEAASQATPTIASRLGGIPELIKLCGGGEFSPGNEAELLAAIQKHLKNNLSVKTLPPDNYAAWLLAKISS
ncbi:MAG TPA: glycosyltransferase [bacterium]|nr:glycosyltransferase [bacterium]HPT29973.1 glycosyltransferase [bacterium]